MKKVTKFLLSCMLLFASASVYADVIGDVKASGSCAADVESSAEYSIVVSAVDEEGNATAYTLEFTGAGAVSKTGYDNAEYQDLITLVEIGNEITSLPQQFCKGFKGLTTVNFEEDSKVTEIPKQAFFGCTSLENLELPQSIKELYSRCFSGTKLTLTLHEGLEKLDNACLEGINNVNINIPSSVKFIGRNVLYNTKTVKIVTVTPGNENYTSQDSNGNELNVVLSKSDNKVVLCANSADDVRIPVCAKSIEMSLLWETSSRINRNIYIPKSIMQIGTAAFASAGTRKIILEQSDPTSIQMGSNTSSNVFDYFYSGSMAGSATTKNCALYVPYGSSAAYKSADQWGTYFGNENTFENETKEYLIGTASSYIEIPQVQEINDDDEYTISGADYKLTTFGKEDVTMTYERNFAAGNFASVCVPFDVYVSQLAENFDVFTLNQVLYLGEGNFKINLVKASADAGNFIAANTPFVLRAKTAQTSFTVSGTNLYAASPEAKIFKAGGYDYNFYCTYDYVPGTEMLANHAYAFQNGNFVFATSATNNLKACRFYMTITDENGDPVQAKNILVDIDETTGIEQATVNSERSSEFYNLNGVRVNKDSKGVVISEGKKYIVK